MNTVKTVLNPELINLLLKTKPVFKKRTPLWFFTNEINVENSAKQKGSDEPHRRLKRNEIWNLWNTMRPEAKRRYFNMAEIDEVRYKEQRALWVAEIGSLISSEKGTDLKRLAKVSESFQLTNQENPLPMYQQNYDCMIQSESTKTLYKELADKVEKITLQTNSETLISDVPRDFRPLLKRPRRPPSPFVLYAHDNKEQLAASKLNSNLNITYLAFAAMQWAKLDPSERGPYEKKYKHLLDVYNKAMEQFKVEISKSSDSNIEQACKERRAFRMNLRKKLRECEIVPVNVRNSFVFYLKENPGISLVDVTKMWRTLPEEQKLKYRKLSGQDNARYYKQKSDFELIKQSLNSLLND